MKNKCTICPNQINSNNNVNKSNTFFDIIEDDLEENPNPYINNRQTTLGSTEVPLNRQTTLGSTEVPLNMQTTLGSTEVPLNRQTTLGSSDSLIKENNLSTEVPTEVPSKRQTKASFKESLVKRSKTLGTSDIGTHIVEGSTKSQYKTPKNILNEKTITDESNIPDIIGTAVTKGGNSKEESQRLYIDPKELTGSQGLKRIMDYTDSKTPYFLYYIHIYIF